MTIIIFGTFVFGVFAMRVTRYFELERWQASLGLILLAILLYLLGNFLIQYFIKKQTPEMASSEEVIPGVQLWELTAGLGVVPLWVSYIGLLSISALITAILPWVIELLKKL